MNTLKAVILSVLWVGTLSAQNPEVSEYDLNTSIPTDPNVKNGRLCEC